ncbi:hypothetical protein NN561_012603 [Cricetulus griseus]
MTSFSRYTPGFREVGQAERAGRLGTGIRARSGAGGRAGRRRDGQHLGQLSARGPGLWLRAGRARCLHNAPLLHRQEEETQAGSAHPWSPRQLGVLPLREQGASTAPIRAGRTEGEAREKGNCPVPRQGHN